MCIRDRRLIDYKSAIPFILVGVPVGISGALLLTTFKEFEEALRGIYGLLMLILSLVLIKQHTGVNETNGASANDAPIDKLKRPIISLKASDGATYTYYKPRQGAGAIATGVGGFLTGLLGVGIGEVVMPQLARRNGVPIPVAAATSVFVVIVVVAAASFTQISSLVAKGCLLYTSPSPRDRQKSRMPSSA